MTLKRYTLFVFIVLLAGCSSTLSPSTSDTDFYFSMDLTEFDTECEMAKNIAEQNIKKYATKMNENLLIGQTVFVSKRSSCVKKKDTIYLYLVLIENPEDQLSSVGGICARVDKEMNLESWRPYC